MSSPSSVRKLCQTTRGWNLCALWCTGDDQWIPLRILKESNSVEVVDYVASNGLLDNGGLNIY